MKRPRFIDVHFPAEIHPLCSIRRTTNFRGSQSTNIIPASSMEKESDIPSSRTCSIGGNSALLLQRGKLSGIARVDRAKLLLERRPEQPEANRKSFVAPRSSKRVRASARAHQRGTRGFKRREIATGRSLPRNYCTAQLKS